MGTAHKVISACLRVLEFCCCAIILGLLARFFYHLNQLDGPTDSRLVYTISIAAISVAFTFFLIPPVRYSFYCFPIDFALFICWIVSFALLQDVCAPETTSCDVQNEGALFSYPLIPLFLGLLTRGAKMTALGHELLLLGVVH